MSDGDGRDDDPDREAILARRKKLIAVALAGLTSAAACGGDDDRGEPLPCLGATAMDSGTHADDSGIDAEPMPCLGALPPDAGPDGGELDAGEPDGGDGLDGGIDTDAEPMACLRMAPPPDGGDGDASA